MCRWNFRPSWVAEGGYDFVAEASARGEAATQLNDRALLQAMLDVEVALLRALAQAGMTPAQTPGELANVADAATFDLAELGRDTAAKGTPIPGLLRALRARLSAETADHLHEGATSQDVIDTAMMLLTRRPLESIVEDLARGADAAPELAGQHRRTLLSGRTLLQQASPLSFGLKAAGWLRALDGAREGLVAAQAGVLAVQLGGAVGTLAALRARGLVIVSHVAGELRLAEPVLPWHTVRLRPVRVACALGTATGAVGQGRG